LELFGKIFGTHSKTVPALVAQSLVSHFADAAGVEWTMSGNTWEAIFYHRNVEKIARFDTSGMLTEYRVNVAPHEIPSPILEAVSGKWEIMNCIAIYTSDKLSYELIVRDPALVRYQLWLDSLGNNLRLDKL
jgi:hypothetical protein